MEWTSVGEKLPNVTSEKFRVKRQNDIETEAFYYLDAMCWISKYGLKTSHWWNAKGMHEGFYDVTHWMPMMKPTED